ncbi:MAG TPA: DUF4129 domain-containing protein, partial [Microbacteriaceae bacterium]|nr:DUF4129 domain-containing protein [Microbacteriaceae bacterium]
MSAPWTAPPLSPDGGTARSWLIGELSKPAYQAARPTWFDVLSARLKDWVTGLFTGAQAPLTPLLAALGIAIAAAIVIG